MKILNFLRNFGVLKRVPRTGWLIRGVSMGDVESVSEHVSRTILIASIISNLMILEGRRLDKGKVMEIAILHDLSESFLMDIDRQVAEIIGLNVKKKIEKELEVILVAGLPNEIETNYIELFNDFNKGKSLEAKVVRLADRLETLIQGLEYVRAGYPKTVFKDIYDDMAMLDDLGSVSVKRLIDELKAEVA